MVVNEIEIQISHPDKVLFGDSVVTKLQLAEYYLRAYPYMKTHIEGRPLSMERFPNGIDAQGFYQKEAADYFPGYIKRVRVSLKTQPPKQYVTVENAETLVFLTNQANIPVHTWLSRKGNLKKPDMMIWDFDPSDGDFEKVRECAFLCREALSEYGIEPFVKTSGSKGVHVAIPIVANQVSEKVKDFALLIAERMVAEHPDLMTLEMKKDDRGDRVFVDYLRNSYAATAAAPYSVRPKEGAPVAMPITWEELKSKKLHAQSFNIQNALKRISEKGELWHKFFEKPVDLKTLTKK